MTEETVTGTTAQVPIAIVGMGVLFPGSPDLRTYWDNLISAADAISDVPPRRWDTRYYEPRPSGPRRPDQIYCRRGGFVDDLATAEPDRFGIDPDTAATMEPEQLIALQVAAAAIDDAGGPARLGDPARVGVVLGRSGYLSPGLVRLDQRVRTARQLVHTLGGMLPSLSHEELEQVRAAFTDALGPDPAQGADLGLMPNLVASRLANRLDLRGPAYTVDAACASSLIAVDAAVNELAGGRCDAVLAGGVHHSHDVTVWSLFSQLGALSPSQLSRPLHADSDGFLIGEGTGVVVLKRLADAEAAGDRIYAVIRGTGVASDGRVDGAVTDPDPAGQAAAITRAWAAAGLDPRQPGSVGLIEAHGLGTPAADGAELAALAEVFGPAAEADSAEVDIAVIGSVKSMIGHAMPAAGVAGLIKAALAVHHGVLLPTLNCEQPNPAMDRTRFRPLLAASPWVAAGPRRAGVSAFGFGGINAHVVLEQAPQTADDEAGRADPAAAPAGQPQPTAVTVDEPEQVLRFAAPTPEALIDLLEGDDATLRQRGTGVPAYLGPGSRLGLVGPTERRLAVARRVARGARGGGWAAWRGRNDVWLSSEPLLAGTSGRTAFVYPGLEAEFSPRIDDVADHFGLPRVELSADGIGRHGSGVLRIGRVLERALHRMGVTPQALAGHSIGEWSAMFAAKMFDEADIDQVIFGSVMVDLAALDVDYASLACPVDQALEAIAGYPELALSHDNAPQQTIVCGPPESIQRLAGEQRKKNVLVQVLPFRSGFHTPMLAPYLAEISERTDVIPIQRGPQTELWSATLVDRYPDQPAAVRELFLRHLLEPVRFRPMVLAMYDAGVRVFIQVGQGRLSGLISDTLGHRPHLTIAANSSRRSGMDQLRRVAVALWVEGGVPRFDVLESRPDLAALRARQPRHRSREAGADGRPAGGDAGDRQPRQVKLELGSELITLDPAVLPRPVHEFATASGLSDWAHRDPLANELLGLLTDTAHTAVAALAGAEAGPYDDAAARDWLDPEPEPEPEPEPIEALTERVRVSVETMPYLMDHCLAVQRRGWPDLSDLRPVMPATTIVKIAMDLAEKAAPGRVVVGVHDVRFDRWLPAAPPSDVTVAVQPHDEDTVTVSFGGYARAVLRLATAYPDTPRPLWPHDPSQERTPEVTGPELYSSRWMFHGPQFQGVVNFLGHSDTHVRAVLTPTTAPGSLLDAAGQMLAYFARVNLPDRYIIFPGLIERIEVYGPEPPPGTPVTTLMWVPNAGEDWLTAFFQLVVDGKVWAEVTGWMSRRFDVHPETDEAFRFPERKALSQRMPGDWMIVSEHWSDLASRDAFAGRYLGAAERDEMQAQPPRGRRHWFLGRVAAKDAVRTHLWDAGAGPIFPAELRVANTAEGVPYVVGEHGFDLPPVRVSVAHCGEMAVAMARPGTIAVDGAGAGATARVDGADVGTGPGKAGVGIDIEEIREHPESTLDAALTPDEQTLMNDLAARTGLGTARCFTRFWTAKEAAAKAVGTGLGGTPRRFVVTTVDDAGERLRVTVPSGQVVEVSVAEVSNPPNLTKRDYVVAWTELDRIEAHRGGSL